eukprot:TRINITY_DN5079_c0_g1_i1.p1 TRINITY_DN5079_c0_g1~~TRINITY_DN5079_c0_g1_i1.p1  ORF type:complete len:359 (-),score=86.43 TRINITY_DN5079_c0_g1_i1:156-1232(-)
MDALFGCFVLLACLAAATEHGDPFISGTWAVQGLGQLNATFLTHVCLRINGTKSSETWYMQTQLTKEQQENFHSDVLEVKYIIDSDLSFNVTSPTPWVYMPAGVPAGQEEGSPGMMQFTATAVREVHVFPDGLREKMTEERKKYIGRARYCLYEYTGVPSQLGMKMACSSSKPQDGFYRFGEAEEYPPSMPAEPVVLSKGKTCEASSVPAIWPMMQAGYRLELALATEMEAVTSDSKRVILHELATKLEVSESRLELVQVVPGSVVLRMFYGSPRSSVVDSRFSAVSSRYTSQTGEHFDRFSVIGLSYEWSPATEVVVSDTTADGRLQPVPAPLMLGVCMLGVGLYVVVLRILVKEES